MCGVTSSVCVCVCVCVCYLQIFGVIVFHLTINPLCCVKYLIALDYDVRAVFAVEVMLVEPCQTADTHFKTGCVGGNRPQP